MQITEWLGPMILGVLISGVGLFSIHLSLTGSHEDVELPRQWRYLVSTENTALRRAVWFVIGAVSLLTGLGFLVLLVI